MQLARRSRCSKWQPAPIRTPRRRRKAMMLQAKLDAKSIAGAGPRGAPHHSRHSFDGSGPGAAEKRSFSCPEPQNGHSSTNQCEHPTSYSYIRLTGRRDAWRDPCGESASRPAAWHWAFGGARRRIARHRSSTSIIAANNTICGTSCAVDPPHVAQLHLLAAASQHCAALRIDAAARLRRSLRQ